MIKKLGKQLKKFGMQVVQDQVWGRVSENREAHKSTRLYIDEMHLLLREEQTAAYTVEIWKRFRKWGGIPTGMKNLCMKYPKKLRPEKYGELARGVDEDPVKRHAPELLPLRAFQPDIRILPAACED